MGNERFARLERLVGPEGLEKLENSKVTIIGLGAVGSYAVEAIARSGVGHLRLIDHDDVSVSNINRQLYALDSTVGKPKAELARQRVFDINPHCKIEALKLFVNEDTLDQALSGSPDILIDAIDSFLPKVKLLKAVVERRIPVISSMGAALRTDPSLIRVGPLYESSYCPLARKVRKLLRKWGASVDFPCVYSLEPTHELREGAIGTEEDCEDQPDHGRKRKPMGSLPTLTGIFGLTAANAAIKTLLSLK